MLGGITAAVTGLMGTPFLTSPAAAEVATGPALDFTQISVGEGDQIVMPEGYTAQTLIPWGTPITGSMPALSPDNSGEEQTMQIGMQHDGMHYVAIDGSSIEPRFLLAVAAGQVLKGLAAQGVSVVRVQRGADGAWAPVEDAHNRRVHALTPITIGGAVKGSVLVKTKDSPTGEITRGTINNCAHGVTSWNTCVAAEEKWACYFTNMDTEDQKPN